MSILRYVLILLVFKLKEIIEITVKTLNILYNKSKITLEVYDEMVTVIDHINNNII